MYCKIYCGTIARDAVTSVSLELDRADEVFALLRQHAGFLATHDSSRSAPIVTDASPLEAGCVSWKERLAVTKGMRSSTIPCQCPGCSWSDGALATICTLCSPAQRHQALLQPACVLGIENNEPPFASRPVSYLGMISERIGYPRSGKRAQALEREVSIFGSSSSRGRVHDFSTSYHLSSAPM